MLSKAGHFQENRSKHVKALPWDQEDLCKMTSSFTDDPVELGVQIVIFVLLCWKVPLSSFHFYQLAVSNVKHYYCAFLYWYYFTTDKEPCTCYRRWKYCFKYFPILLNGMHKYNYSQIWSTPFLSAVFPAFGHCNCVAVSLVYVL